jgi:hypothetical protein
MREDYTHMYPDTSTTRINKFEYFKRNLLWRQQVFLKPSNKAKGAIIALFKVTKSLEGEEVKEAPLKTVKCFQNM